MSDVRYAMLELPVGKTMVAWSGAGLVSIRFGSTLAQSPPDASWDVAGSVDCDPVRQLVEYFDGDRRDFDLPVVVHGTEFQRRVWKAVAEVPYGRVRSYAAIAAAIGSPTAVRAVGAANGQNDIPIVIPCHRIVGSDGALRGYAGGVGYKAALLEFERHGHWNAALCASR